jgi:Ser/Thr protein kinase RdoA (MazF antagonist)
MGPQLVVLAAGLGRRFGGDKQFAEVGPSGEWLLDYALYDARQAGFSEAVLVVRPGMEEWARRPFPLPVRLAIQDRPLGTAHAVWSARKAVTGPFAVVNADDFYGRESYEQLAGFLRSECHSNRYALIGFPLEETLSDSGPVARALCRLDADGYLSHIEERKDLRKGEASGGFVSMNCWAFHPSFLDFLDEKMPAFLMAHEKGGPSELFLPHLAGETMEERHATIKVIPTRSQWLGMTFASDLEQVKARLAGFVAAGRYPTPLDNPVAAVFPEFFPESRPLGWKRLEGGHIHQTFLVDWEKEQARQRTIFQRLNPHVFPDPEGISSNNLIVAEHLHSRGYPREILHPVETPGGQTVIWSAGFPWRAFPYQAGTYNRKSPVSESEVFKAAAAIGEWHTFLKDLDPGLIKPAIPGFFDVESRWMQWERAKANAIPERLKQAAAEIAGLESRKELVARYAALSRQNLLPQRILHGDPKLANLLFDEKTEEVRAIIDWDTVQPGWVVFDFGDMVRAYTNPSAEDESDISKVKLHEPYLKALTEGFLSQTSHWLTPAEKDHLMLGAQWVIWVQALRFLADYLVGDVYYPVKYPEHNLVRGRNQLVFSFQFSVFS